MHSLYHDYVQVGDGEHSRETDVHSEYARQREHMERTVSALRKKLAKDTEIHRTDKIRVMQVMMIAYMSVPTASMIIIVPAVITQS